MKRFPDGTWINPETGEVIAADLPRRLQSAVDAALGACCSLGGSHDEQINRSLQKRAERKLAELQAECDQVTARIDHGWGWLERHPGHESFGEREGHVLTWINQYEHLDNAICAATVALS